MSSDGITAVIPIRLGMPRKSRMSSRLSLIEREKLADQLFNHVVTVIREHPRVGRTIVLSPVRPPMGTDFWRKDRGRGLNVELDVLRRDLPDDDLLVIHGDLPLLGDEDVTAMVNALQAPGTALAPDHGETGTNAVAIHAGQPFAFSFGDGSLAAHVAASDGKAFLVRRLGLALDVDRPEDLEAAERQGFLWSRS